MTSLSEYEDQIQLAMRADQFGLHRLLKSMQRAQAAGKPFDRNLRKFQQQLKQSTETRERRSASVPQISWPEDLPVVGRRQEIAEAIRDHQVIVVCGETGSGKSTQLPKIALELGRGVGGVIGHTQPRRIAARSIATRVSEELNCQLGAQVGYRIRFNDASGPNTLIRLMTDGIMLAETQSDRFLDQYDTIIIDEAHERSLNIDFLLGYLKRLLPKRPDLRLIITSATIDAERFAQHFVIDGKPAPVLVVEGRTYPVEVRYRPLDEEVSGGDGDTEPRDWLDGVRDAIDECASIDNGHILVFLPTERDIREVDRKLGGKRYPGDTHQHPTQIVPLFGRLSMADQAKVFQPYQHRRIVLATNVAESSLTVPGIRYVVDTGTARISRYSARSRMQRLPIEAVSQASANQRAGRCGRVGPGICIRLYSEEDYGAREAFTAPEIQRTNLAAVILRTMNLKLGQLDEFPFIDPPRTTTVREGYKTLIELGAIQHRNSDGGHSAEVSSTAESDYVLTETGRQMAALPVDPRVSRMILAAIDEQSVPEVMVIASALESQDPRDRPVDKQQAADEAHAQFVNNDSDFLTFLNMWDTWHERKKKLSGSQLRKWCRQNFLSWMRMREWIDVHRQLRDLLSESRSESLKKAARLHPVKDRRNDFAAIHKALTTGLLANLAWKSADGEYTGAGGHKLAIWPGSALFSKGPKWFVAAELVETSRRYARTIARIQPDWIEALAGHLVKREHSEPHWDGKSGNVMAFEKVTLWGLPIVPRRRVPYAKIDPAKSRELLIQYGLVEFGLLYGQTEDQQPSQYEEEQQILASGVRSQLVPGRSTTARDRHAADGSHQNQRLAPWSRDFAFLKHNAQVLKEVGEMQARTRQRDLLPGDDVLFDWYDKRIPKDIGDRNRLKRWYQKARKTAPALLQFEVNQFTDESQREESHESFPPTLKLRSMELPISYQLDPGRDADGVTVTVPREGLPQLDEHRLSWLVPGLVEQKVLALIRSLPKSLRRNFVPAPDTAAQVTSQLQFGTGNLLQATAQQLSRICGEPIRIDNFDLASLPDHLNFNVRVVDHDGKTLAEDRSLTALREQLAGTPTFSQPTAELSAEERKWQRTGLQAWDFDRIPVSIEIQRAGMAIQAFPIIQDDGQSVSLSLRPTAAEAEQVMKRGLRRLFLIQDQKLIRQQVENLPRLGHLRIQASCIRGLDLAAQLQVLMAERAYLSGKTLPRTQAEFEQAAQQGRALLPTVAQEFAQLIPQLFEQYHLTRRHLENAKAPGGEALLKSITRQLQHLMNSQFLATTPWPWLIQYPRYFTAIRQRLQRLSSGGLKTELKLEAELHACSSRYEQRKREHEEQQRDDPMLDHYRWMLEEYRVSLFAQRLGTAIKVSPEKLDEHWLKVS
jgi:ATP-dependent helicase HrpA